MSLQQWFDKGITKEAYMAELDEHKEGFEHIYKSFSVPELDLSTLESVEGVRVIVLAEVWCGHCMLNIPLLLRLTEAANIPVRFLLRDSHLPLMDQYLTNGKRVIPIFIFMDEHGNEIGKWGPRAPEVEDYIDTLKQDLPDKSAADYEEKFKILIEKTGKRFTEDEALWQTVYTDIKSALLQSVSK